MKRLGRYYVIAVVAVISLMFFTACGGKDDLDAFATFAGVWSGEEGESSFDIITIYEDGSWVIYKDGGLYSKGELDYHSEDDSVWISPENNTQWSQLYIEDDGSLYCGPLGYFQLTDVSLEDMPKPGEGNSEEDVDADSYDETEDSEGSGEDVGDDWRNSGVVVGSGTITHENEGSVDVLVTVDDNSAAFYWDDPEQVLFDSVSFPITIPDAQEYFKEISFDDINGDGESDVSIYLADDTGESITMNWIWDPEERYVFQEN